MNNCIAVINQKGGVGKTATAYNIAYLLSKTAPTLIIDLDSNANATSGFTANKNFVCTAYDLFEENFNKRWEDFICPFPNTGSYLRLIPGDIKLALTERSLIHKPFKETKLIKKIPQLFTYLGNTDFGMEPMLLSKRHDLYKKTYTILDCPPNLSELTINAMYAADFILVPMLYDEDSLKGLVDLQSVINEIKEGQRYQLKVLRNKYNETTKHINNYVNYRIENLKNENYLMETIIRQCAEICMSKTQHLPVELYDNRCRGSADYLKLTEEIIKITNEISSLKEIFSHD